MTNDSYPRDLVGYGRTPPHAAWPGGARIAIQMVLNYEEGGENCILHGDKASEAFLSEIVGPRVRGVVGFLLEILATIPSVVYGMWGLFILAPWIAEHVQPYAKEHWQPMIDSIFGVARVKGRMVPNFPLFWYPGFPNGLGLGTATLVLSIMILPMIVSISLDALRAVPKSLREGALGLGATRWEMIRIAVLPYSRAGISGAAMLGLGRAIGETIAVTIVIGNAPSIGKSLFDQGYTLAAVIANEFGEAASTPTHRAALIAAGLVLFVLTLIINGLARYFVIRGERATARRVPKGMAG